mmetsp:Transcript_49564/g.165549  ORF Transcript_49564/g.165549 Transcript_49564/m.165549 type:complete len:244 (+) Transcript_49564:1-732(+)
MWSFVALRMKQPESLAARPFRIPGGLPTAVLITVVPVAISISYAVIVAAESFVPEPGAAGDGGHSARHKKGGARRHNAAGRPAPRRNTQGMPRSSTQGMPLWRAPRPAARIAPRAHAMPPGLPHHLPPAMSTQQGLEWRSESLPSFHQAPDPVDALCHRRRRGGARSRRVAVAEAEAGGGEGGAGRVAGVAASFAAVGGGGRGGGLARPFGGSYLLKVETQRRAEPMGGTTARCSWLCCPTAW